MVHVLQSELFRLRKRPQSWIMPVLVTVFIVAYYAIGIAVSMSASAAEREETRQSVRQLSSIFENGMQIWRGTALVMIVVMASSLIGSEYGWNTLRPLVARCSSRTDLLSAKWAVVGLYTTFMVIVGVVVSMLASTIATLIMGTTASLPIAVWDDMLLGALRWIVATMPYAAIAFAAAMITRSNAAGVAIGIGVNFAELLVIGLFVQLIDDFEPVVEYGINWNVQQMVNITTDDGGTAMDPVSTGQVWKSTLILALYCLAAIAVTYRVFTRRDITSG